MSNYWKDRMIEAQAAISNKSRKQIEKQMAKYYGRTAKKVIADFEKTYKKILAQQDAGKTITPADLYKLDRYWQMQAQVRQELRKLGEKEVSLLTKIFEQHFFEIYYSINIDGLEAFSTIDAAIVSQMIGSIWTADGKHFSQRIWDNTTRLIATLDEELIHCITTGKKPTELKNLLQERFGVSYRRADALVRTEMAHIQTQAAQTRYKDYGLKEVEIWADKDERRCEVCGKLHKTRYPVGDHVPIPAHTNCRCSIIPVIE